MSSRSCLRKYAYNKSIVNHLNIHCKAAVDNHLNIYCRAVVDNHLNIHCRAAVDKRSY